MTGHCTDPGAQAARDPLGHGPDGPEHGGSEHGGPEHGSHGGHGHSHGPRPGSAAAEQIRPLTIAFGLGAVYMVVEIVAGILTNSLALLSDGAHMATDVLGLGLALAAIQVSRRRSSSQATFGTYRLEVLAAVVNALLLFGVGAYVLVEAVLRLRHPNGVPGATIIVIASIGLVVNIVSMMLLRSGAKQSLNVRGAYLEVVADMLGSVGVIVAGLITVLTDWPYADPIIGAGIGLLVLPRTYRLLRQAVRILMEAAPPGVDVEAAEAALGAIPGVQAVHDLHIWTVTDGIESATAHIVLSEQGDWHAVLDEARDLLAVRFGVTHATIQVEPPDHVEQPAVV